MITKRKLRTSLFAILVTLTLGADARAQTPHPNAVPAHVVGVLPTARGQLILLQAADRDLYLPIWVAEREAQAARGYLHGQRSPRPLTHDLLLNAVTSLGGRITAVFVSEIRGQNFIGRVDVVRDGVARQLDARSSDAVCVGLGAGASISIMVHVLAQAGLTRAQLAAQGIVVPAVP